MALLKIQCVFLIMFIMLGLGCEGQRMVAVEQGVSDLDSRIQETKQEASQLKAEKKNLDIRFEEMSARVAVLEKAADQNDKTMAKILRRLDQIEVSVRDSMKASQVETRAGLSKDLAEMRIANDKELKALREAQAALGKSQESIAQQTNQAIGLLEKDLNRFDREIDQVYKKVKDMLERESTDSYEVQNGDTLSKIAQNFGVTLKALMEANQLDSKSVIHPGQELMIP
jgi:LysM repeat protein